MTLLRKAEYRALALIRVHGRVLDLGGGKGAPYHALVKGAAQITVANKDAAAHPDILCDFEESLPIEDAAFDSVLLMNVLEHVFEYRRLLYECARVLTPGGQIIITVPYLFPYHPSPEDFHRFSASALVRALTAASFTDIRVEALGTGVMAARWALLERLLPESLQSLSTGLAPIITFADDCFTVLARALGKKYDPADYALGFIATATKP